jgi:hypothetical protein
MADNQHDPRGQEDIRDLQPQEEQGLSRGELQEQQASDLPDRDAMSLVNANLAIPINAALAANVLSDGANAGAGAVQQTPIGQGI